MPLRLIRLIAAAGLLATPLAACETAQTKPPDFGVALRHNIAAQIANPDARYRRDLPPASDGSRSALAADRYARGAVTPLSTTGASSVGSAAAAGEATAAAPPP